MEGTRRLGSPEREEKGAVIDVPGCIDLDESTVLQDYHFDDTMTLGWG